MNKDALHLGTDIFRISLTIGALSGLIFTILCIIVSVRSDFIKHSTEYYIKLAIKSIACFVVVTMSFTFISNNFLDLYFDRTGLVRLGGIKAIEEEALKNGVSNLEDLNSNIEYLSEKYKDEIYKLNYRSTLNYSLNEVETKPSPKLDESDYINSILNKFYLNKDIVESVALLINETNLEYDKVYKELKN